VRGTDTLGLFLFTALAPTATYTLSLHDALPISADRPHQEEGRGSDRDLGLRFLRGYPGVDPRLHRIERKWPLPEQRIVEAADVRSEEHTSELQSQSNLVCRLLLEKKNSRRIPRL